MERLPSAEAKFEERAEQSRTEAGIKTFHRQDLVMYNLQNVILLLSCVSLRGDSFVTH